MIFDQAALDAIVKDSLVDVPSEHKLASVLVVNKDGIREVLSYRPDSDSPWEFGGYIQYDRNNHGIDYGAELIWSK